MHLSIDAAPETSKVIIDEMMQSYFAELEHYSEIGTNTEGRYEYAYLDAYWLETEERYPFLIWLDGSTVGFVLVNRYSRLGNEGSYSVAEFYVAPDARRHSVGTRAAHQVFKRFPGRWEVGVLEQNLPARRFWEHAIRGLVGDTFVEHTNVWKGPVFSFSLDSSTYRT